MDRRGQPFFAVLLLLAACAGPQDRPPASSTQRVVTGVTVARVERRPIATTLEAVGTVASRKQSVLSAKIVAPITAIRVREGDRVHADQVLIELDAREVNAQLQRASAGLREAKEALEEVEQALRAAEQAIVAATAQQDLARATLTRYEALLARRSVAPQEYDEVVARQRAATAEVARAQAVKASILAKRQQVRAKIAQAEAEVAHATVTLDYATLRAPFAGIVTAKPAEVGTLAAPGVPLLTIEEERYRLEVTVPESAVGQIREGQTVPVLIDAVQTPLAGPVVEIVPAADPHSRTFTVKVELPREPELRSGLYGKAQFAIGQTAILTVPRTAVVERGQLQGVFVLEPDRYAHLRLIKTGKVYDEEIEVLSGLIPGEHVVVAGVEKVTDGSRLEGGL